MKRVNRYFKKGLEVIAADNKIYRFGPPDERGFRLLAINGERERYPKGCAKIETDIKLGLPMRFRNASESSTPGSLITTAAAFKIEPLPEFGRQIIKEMRKRTQNGGFGDQRQWVKMRERRPDNFESLRRILLLPLAKTVEDWFRLSNHVGDNLLRVANALLGYFPADFTDYIEGKLTEALQPFGYVLVKAWGDEKYTQQVLDKPPHFPFIPDKVRINNDLAISKTDLSNNYIKPLLAALWNTKDHVCDEAAHDLIEAAVHLLDDEEEVGKINKFRSFECALWYGVFHLGYRLISAELKKQDDEA